MNYNVISTGSKGNAVIINGEILIDCGVPFKKLRPYIKDLKLVLLTHVHGDHFNRSTVRRLHEERPALRFGGCEWMAGPLLEAGVDKRVIDVYPVGYKVNYVLDKAVITIQPEKLVHDVLNCGYRIFIGDEKLFYATDTGALDGIEAKGYDLYMIEANHTQAEIEARFETKMERGEFAYEYRAAANHLSREQAEDWLYRNMGPNSRYVFLHGHEGPRGAGAGADPVHSGGE